MRTRSSSNLPVESPPNPSTSNPKRRNRRSSKQPFILEESPVDTMTDQRTMAELLRAPTEGYAEAIVVPPILAEQFELMHSLINMITSDQFFGLERKILMITSVVNQQKCAVTTAMTAILKQFQATPPPASVKAVEEICVTCGGAHPYYQCLAADGNTFSELRDNIQGYIVAAVNYNQVVPLNELEKVKRMNEANMKAMKTQINNVKNELRNEIKNSIQASMSNQTNELKNMMASFFQMNTASTSGSGSLPSNTIANPKGELKAIATRSGTVLDGPSIPIPPPLINPEEDERVEETLMDQYLAEYTIKVLPSLVQKPKPPSQRNFVVHQRDPLHPNIPYLSRILKQKQQEKDEVQIHKFWQMFKQLHINITLADALILISKYQKMLKALLSNKEKLLELANTPLNENCSAVILKKLPEKLRDPRKFLILCGFSLPELISTRMTPELANRAICTLAGIARDVFVLVGKLTFPADFVIVDYDSDPRVPFILGRPFLRTARALIDVHGEEMILHDIFNPEGGNVLIEKFLDLDSTEDLHPPHHVNPLSGSTTSSSSPNQLLEEFADELALITFPPGNNDLLFDSESNLKEIEYLLHHDSIKDIDSILKYLIDQSNLVDLNDNLVDSMPQMFTDEHALDYSSPPLYDEYDDDLFEVDDFLLPSEYDSFLSEDFSKVDAFSSTNNVDKVFNPGILIQEDLFEIITRVALDKKLAIFHASLILEDFDPPLYELPFFKEVLSAASIGERPGEACCYSGIIDFTNFPDHVGAKDLWHACKQYGQVIDAFIPDRRSKDGKRFGFVRLIKVFDVDRLVGNLCTVWIGKHHLHAKVARFTRPLAKNSRTFVNKDEKLRGNSNGTKTDSAERDSHNSYAYVVKGWSQVNGEKDNNPVLVLDDSCVNQQEFSWCLNWKVKEFGALVNLKVVMRNEGFSDVKLKYLGGLWVMIVFNSMEAKEKFISCVAINSWFAQLIQASSEFIVDERVTWMDIEGIPLKLWTNNTFKKIASKWGSLINVEKSEEENFHSKRLCIHTNRMANQGEDDLSVVPDTLDTDVRINGDEGAESKEVNEKQSTDPFGIYSLLKKRRRKEKNESSNKESLQFPLGFTPREEGECNDSVHDNNTSVEVNSANLRDNRTKKDGMESMGSGHIQKVEVPWTGGSILSLMDELIKVGQTIGYKMDSESNGNSGGILCVWNPNVFNKVNATVLDYFIMIHGDWLSNGEVIIMGDFNEVRNKSERFGLSFNVQGAKAFNSFIVISNLEEVPLGGCSFTWYHSSASKMSKLDRFLISKAFLRDCPSISAITLDRFLSDHRPILLRESDHDFGPISFRFFHYCLEVEGFEKLIIDIWQEAPGHSSNAMINFMQKLKFVKDKIRKTDLEAEVSIEEIKKAVWDRGIDKSPGPDGFTFGFYKRFWDLFESDVVAAVKSFFQSESFQKGCNSSFITLIPKIPDTKLVKDFRPISLIGSLYKIISKILANRLVLVLGDLVNEVQSAFVADRQILDGPFILNEVYQWCKSKRKQTFVLKIDFEKAYDSVRWDYVGDVLTLEDNKAIDVASKMDQENLSNSFRRFSRSGVEKSQMEDLLVLLEGVILGSAQDRWRWSLEGS
nr:RNA-directed DNA polymerase, eukaryota, nucleotide-binding alpha-beta plait domain protein [Tanacetum cinerariifolium]